VSRRPAGGGAALTVAAALMLHAAPAISSRLRLVRPLMGIRDELDDRRTVGLTFDDGPHPKGTPAVLEILAGRGARATFFLAGEQVLRYPSVAAEIAAAGHEIAIHCHEHRPLLRLTPWQLREDLRRAEAAITEETGKDLREYRPPYGVLSSAALLHARARGWQTTLWTRWGSDWSSEATPASISEESTKSLRGGEIMLLHDADHYADPDSWRATVGALPLIIDHLDDLRLSPVALN
jgi:peptidoglycan/xylan/chitin deacetylase (PgdA/CDA1 family)